MSTPEEYFDSVPEALQPLGAKLAAMFAKALPNCKIKVWHSIPVWFDEGNPIVTYFVKKDQIFVMFWNGQKFSDGGAGMKPVGKYSAAEVGYSTLDDLNVKQMNSWLIEARDKPQTDLAMRVKV